VALASWWPAAPPRLRAHLDDAAAARVTRHNHSGKAGSVRKADRSVRESDLARLGAVAAVLGAIVLFGATLLHPLGADPNDAVAAFTEYAADRLWVGSHLGQFLGIGIIGAALVVLAHTLSEGRARLWARVGLAATAASVAMGAALQAVDGIALKAMVDRWAAAAPAERALVFEAALAVRQIEIGLASLFSLLLGLTVIVYAVAIVYDRRFPAWLAWLGALGGLGSVAAGVAQAYTGFSGLAMAISMPASVLLLLWLVGVGAYLWRRRAVPTRMA